MARKLQFIPGKNRGTQNNCLNILMKNSDKSPIWTRDRFGQESDIFRTQIWTRVKFGQETASDKSPVTVAKISARKYNPRTL